MGAEVTRAKASQVEVTGAEVSGTDAMGAEVTESLLYLGSPTLG
jgi:hypothetical protein